MSRPDAGPVEVVLIGAPGCCLCDEAKPVVTAAAERLGARLRQVDISADAALEARYRELIPVVEIDGEAAFTYVVPPVALERRILAAQARRAGAAS